MDGLTNIISKINSDGLKECVLVLNEARENAKALLIEKKQSAENASKKLLADAEKKASLIESKAISGSELEYKRILLGEKCKILDNILEKSALFICSLGDNEYFALLEKLVLANALDGNGEIFFNTRDIERMDADFENKLNSLLPKSKKLVLSKTTIDTEGGFVIEYPEMRIDCTIKSLISDKADEIRDELSKILFS